jgi:hypothetical protein
MTATMTDETTLEELARASGHTYRTVTKRLKNAGIEPIRQTAKSAIYPANAAARAVLVGGEDGDFLVKKLSEHEEFIGKFITPALFRAGSPFISILTGHLCADRGLSKVDAMETASIALLAYMHAINAFFGRDAPNDPGLNHVIPPPFCELSKYGGATPREAWENYVRQEWPDDDLTEKATP